MKTANFLNLLLAAALLCACAALWIRSASPAAAPGPAPAPAAPLPDAALPPRVDADAPETGLPFHGGASPAVEAAFAAIRAASGGAADVAAPAADGAGFREFDVKDDFACNPFTWFTGKGLLLCAGDRESHNAMTIGWGGLGTIWGRKDAVTVYVAESRHTKGFMDSSARFTVMGFDKEKQADILTYMGTHSGRDGDKAAALGLHTAFTPDGTPYYEEAQVVLECETMYAAPFDPAGFKDVPARFYADFPAGIHSLYVGRIVRALKK
jgi:flavin reductase (DIM6/NTAB) family NADH-FMN oxidoreductase RutF